MCPRFLVVTVILTGFVAVARPVSAQATRETEAYRRIKLNLDAVPAIDTHDHLLPFEKLPGFRETAAGKGMNLAGIWGNSYWTQVGRLTPWQPKMAFDDWWKNAKNDWDNSQPSGPISS